MQTSLLVSYLDTLLDITSYRDYCPNGLQVEGRPETRRLVTGVTASLALIDAAIEAGADTLLVHHGYFWKSENPCLTGIKRRRLARLLDADINLLAYHLPLDGHPLYGNNASLAARLGLRIDGNLTESSGPGVVVYGELTEPASAAELAQRIERAVDRKPLCLPAPLSPAAPSSLAATITRVGICTGAGQGFLQLAAERGMDAFISGEVSEQTQHIADEYGIHYFAAGHHATERYGPAALGCHLAEQFGLEHDYIEINNPV